MGCCIIFEREFRAEKGSGDQEAPRDGKRETGHSTIHSIAFVDAAQFIAWHTFTARFMDGAQHGQGARSIL